MKILIRLLVFVLLLVAVLGIDREKQKQKHRDINPPKPKETPKKAPPTPAKGPYREKKSSVFDSSLSNKKKAKENYPDDPVQRRVATVLGDELPAMRDDLIRRKNAGEGAVEIHINAWKKGDNWKWNKDEQDQRKKQDAVKK